MMNFRPVSYDVIPPVVKNLLIINGLLFFAMIILGKQGINIADHLALYHFSSDNFRIWQLVTHMFVHGGNPADPEGGFMHLFSNMFALWMFGSLLENMFGSKRFLIFYLLCGIGASIIYLGVVTYDFSTLRTAIEMFNANPTYKSYCQFLSQNYHDVSSLQDPLIQLKDSWEYDPNNIEFIDQAKYLAHELYQSRLNVPIVGASGAVFGLLFAFGYLFPNTIVQIYFLFPLKAKYFVAIYALLELYLGIQRNPGDNVAHAAHLGGMFIAFIVLKIWNKNNRTHFY